MMIDRARSPFRTIVRKVQLKYSMVVLGDSVVYGTFIRNAVIISCPGATLARMPELENTSYVKGIGVKSMAILGGTNDLVARDGSVTPLKRIQERMERLITAPKDERMKLAVKKVPERRSYKVEKSHSIRLSSSAPRRMAQSHEFMKLT